MATLQGPVICPSVGMKQEMSVSVVPVVRGNYSRSRFLGLGKTYCRARVSRSNLLRFPSRNVYREIRCSSKMSSGNGSMAENFSENDEDYVDSSVVEAVEVKSGADGFSIIMRDRRHLKCVHNNPEVGPLLFSAPTPAIVLKMEDGSDLFLPIIVLETPITMLMEAMRNVKVPRPTVYQIVKDMIEKMGYEVKLVRVTRSVHDDYHAQLYLNKIGDETQRVSFDIRPSDAINIAVLSKVPIQVNKHLAYRDGVRIVDHHRQIYGSGGSMIKELDRPDGKACFATKEFDLVQNMMVAADEERYIDAAQWRDQLNQLRSQKSNKTKHV